MNQLGNYIKSNMTKGYSFEQIKNYLLSLGYSPEQIDQSVDEPKPLHQTKPIIPLVVAMIIIISASGYFLLKPSTSTAYKMGLAARFVESGEYQREIFFVEGSLIGSKTYTFTVDGSEPIYIAALGVDIEVIPPDQSNIGSYVDVGSYKEYIINNPPKGEWKVIVSSKTKTNYGLGVYTKSPIVISLFFDTPKYRQEFDVNARVSYNDEPIDADVELFIISSEEEDSVKLRKKDEIYTNSISLDDGAYRLKAIAEGKVNSKMYSAVAVQEVEIVKPIDLYIDSKDITIPEAKIGDSVKVKGTVHSNSDRTLTTDVYLYTNDPMKGGKIIDTKRVTIPPNSNEVVEFDWTIEGGSHIFFMEISSYTNFIEGDYENNIASRLFVYKQ